MRDQTSPTLPNSPWRVEVMDYLMRVSVYSKDYD